METLYSEQISLEEQVSYLRNAFDHYVSQEFCITDSEAQELLGKAQGNTEVIVSTLKAVGAFLQREESKGSKFPEDEIVLLLVPEELKLQLAAKTELALKPQPVPTQQSPRNSNRGVRAPSGMTRAEVITNLQQAARERVKGLELTPQEAEELFTLAESRVGTVLEALKRTGGYVRSRSFTPSKVGVLDHLKKNIGIVKR